MFISSSSFFVSWEGFEGIGEIWAISRLLQLFSTGNVKAHI